MYGIECSKQPEIAAPQQSQILDLHWHHDVLCCASICVYSLLSEVLDHQVAAYVKGDFLSNFLYILIIFKRQIPKDD